MSGVEIRPYEDADEAEWMRLHAVILSMSHSWNYSIQERPAYPGHASTRLVALADGRMVGLMDTQYENTPGELCFHKETRGGYVLEFGRLPEYGGRGLGERLIEATVEDARRIGINRLEFWSQDRRAQRYYRRIGLPEIGRHYRFRVKPPADVADRMMRDFVGVEYLYCACVPEEWPLVRKKYEVIGRHPLEPHLCVGFELRFDPA